MSSKKKMIIAISSFAMIILAAVVAVVAVMAAQNVTIKSSINVTYTSSEIAGKVTASYQVQGASSATSIGAIEYHGTEANGTSTSLNSSKLSITSLTSTNKYVDFIFTFTNEGSKDYTATLTLPTNSNFTKAYTVPSSGGATKVNDTSFKVAGGTTTAVTYKVRFTITDVSKDASISGNFSWALA